MSHFAFSTDTTDDIFSDSHDNNGPYYSLDMNETETKGTEETKTEQELAAKAEVIQRPRVVSREAEEDEQFYYKVDVVESWAQSSGTISYASVLSDRSLIDEHIKCDKQVITVIPDYRRAELQNINYGKIPDVYSLNANMLFLLNDSMRRCLKKGRVQKRILVNGPGHGRRELIAQMFDDAVKEYIFAEREQRTKLSLRLECGGYEPPRAKVMAGQKLSDIMKTLPTTRPHITKRPKHSVQHLSTCSSALPYPSAPSFSRCSIKGYFERLKEKRKQRRQQ